MTALARLRERGDREAVGEGLADGDARKQPLTPGFALPSPLGEGCYQVRRSREVKTSKLQEAGVSPGPTKAQNTLPELRLLGPDSRVLTFHLRPLTFHHFQQSAVIDAIFLHPAHGPHIR